MLNLIGADEVSVKVDQFMKDASAVFLTSAGLGAEFVTSIEGLDNLGAPPSELQDHLHQIGLFAYRRDSATTAS